MPVRSLLSLAIALAVVGCSGKEQTASDAASAMPSDAPASSAATASATAIADDAKGVSIQKTEEKDGGKWEFVYAWAAAVSAHPELAALLKKDSEAALKEERAGFAETLADSPPDCASCKSRSYGKEWKVVASVPGYLSISADLSSYTGGAHGMYGRESSVWVESSKKLVKGVDMFTSAAALDKALQPALCKALDAERAKKRGPDAPGSDYGFDDCQHVKDSTVFVGSSNGKAFDRIGIYFGPYVAGPYAEGAYELTLPVTKAVLATVKPEYKGAFAAK
ncbi:DUF3298 and DUF4163 domain-containing protein [Tsuneonella flava]|uniref:DUF3298 and DUF4163 domain-containing protein n=1 Tax=Tsuneonella flava TaxID=2055955 RepID=A0ABX7K4Y0_9SPHN|nr:DUF3298 and DUF4163 domain-containing protein [Tsuneonella flava]QSB43295.1 DUF3298 and DUF4163 domain-containing protein [Tsuneonella flava]